MQAIESTAKPLRYQRRGAALYLTTVSISIVMAGMAWTMLAAQRADRRLQANIDLENRAWWGARGAVEIGLAYTDQISTWRSQANTVLSSVDIGDARCTVELFDDRDNALAGGECDSARLVATAACKGSTTRLQASLLPRPHPSLAFCCFGSSSDDMEFRDSAKIKGPVRSHGRIKTSSNPVASGDAYFETLSGYSIDDPLTPKQYTSSVMAAPSANLPWYLAQATPITGTNGTTCEIKGYNLTPTSNPTGAANAGGIYSLDAGGRNVLIENLHLKGTLIIHNATSRSVTFQRALWIEPGPLSYPVLFIDNVSGNTYFAPTDNQLVEISSGLVLVVLGIPVTVGSGVDFNEDGDIADSFTTSVRGLVWASSSRVTLRGATWTFTGSVIAQRLTVENSVTVDNDAQLQNSLSPGFVGTGMRLLSTSFKDAPG